jgi:hypothetical protein
MSEIEANLQRIRRSLAKSRRIAPTRTRTPPVETAAIHAPSSTKSNHEAFKAQPRQAPLILPVAADSSRLTKLQNQHDENAAIVSSENSIEVTKISNVEPELSSNATGKELTLVSVSIWSKLKKKFGWGVRNN